MKPKLASGTWLVIGLVLFALLLAVIAKRFRMPPPPVPTTIESPS
jgi:hypothetical protein